MMRIDSSGYTIAKFLCSNRTHKWVYSEATWRLRTKAGLNFGKH